MEFFIVFILTIKVLAFILTVSSLIVLHRKQKKKLFDFRKLKNNGEVPGTKKDAALANNSYFDLLKETATRTN